MFVMMSMATRYHKILLFTFSSSPPLITGQTCTKKARPRFFFRVFPKLESGSPGYTF